MHQLEPLLASQTRKITSMSAAAGTGAKRAENLSVGSPTASLTPERLIDKLSAAFKIMLLPENISQVCKTVKLQ